MDHLRTGVQDQPGQHGETSSLLKIQKLASCGGGGRPRESLQPGQQSKTLSQKKKTKTKNKQTNKKNHAKLSTESIDINLRYFGLSNGFLREDTKSINNQ